MGRRIKRQSALPFLKWAGGKRALVPEILRHVPAQFGQYFEPFVGGGALFFALASERTLRFNRAYLSDTNDRLMRTYTALAEDAQNVIVKLRVHADKHGKRYFYEQREKDVDSYRDCSVAAWMIYMNRVCFNGVYRVNRSGGFNVPLGSYKNPQIVNEKNLLRCVVALGNANTNLRTCGFEVACRKAKAGDFVYFDPPYYPISKTSNFVSYGCDGFTDDDHVKLRDLALVLKDNDIKVLISNSNAPRVRELYGGGLFKIHEVQAARNVNSKGHLRGKITDLLIT